MEEVGEEDEMEEEFPFPSHLDHVAGGFFFLFLLFLPQLIKWDFKKRCASAKRKKKPPYRSTPFSLG